jgi:hypothetical protein
VRLLFFAYFLLSPALVISARACAMDAEVLNIEIKVKEEEVTKALVEEVAG